MTNHDSNTAATAQSRVKTEGRRRIARGYDESGREALHIFSDDTVELFTPESEPLRVLQLISEDMIDFNQ